MVYLYSHDGLSEDRLACSLVLHDLAMLYISCLFLQPLGTREARHGMAFLGEMNMHDSHTGVLF